MATRFKADRGENAAKQGGDATAARTLLVGTPICVEQLAHALKVAVPAPAVVGCVLPDGIISTSHVVPKVLGDFDSLGDIVGSHAFDLVLVTLPLAMGEK